MSNEIKYSAKTENRSRAITMPEHVAIDSRAYWFIAGLTAMLFVGLMTALPVKAQSYDNRDYQRQNDAYVTVYEDCDYRGRSRDISVGDYRNVRDLDLGNDKISSMRVPNGLELELFEDERFRGGSVTINRDVSCLDRKWNDKTSSLRVSFDDRRQYNDRYNNNHNGSHNRNGDYDREDQYQNRNENSRGDRNNANDGYGGGNQGKDFTKNVSRVEFANSSLVKAKRKHWNMSNRNGTNQSYKELKRDNRVIYLRNAQSRQLLEIDVYSSNAKVISANGRQTNYQITRVGKGSGTWARVPDRIPPMTPNPSAGGVLGVVQGSCFTYKAYARGGQAGIKFQGKDINQKFDDDAVSGRVCHSGSLTMELNKMDPNVDVFVEIQGRTYKFAKGEKEDLLLNTWYRKMVKLKVTG